MLNDPSAVNAKKGAQVFASVYPHLFRHCANDLSSQRTWQTIEHIKATLTQIFDQTGAQGVKIAAIKVFQKIIQVQTRGGGDPRSRTTDISIATVPSNHNFIQAAQLEQEANRLLTKVVTLIFTSNNADLVMASLNSLSFLPKARPSLNKIVIEALVSWTPAALAASPHTHIRNVEKTLRLVFWHFERHGLAGSHEGQIREALQTQKARMESAARLDWERREEEAKRKRHSIDAELQQVDKKQRLADGSFAAQQPLAGPSSTPQLVGTAGAEAFCRAAADENRPNPLAAFDVTTLPLPLVIELILANLTALSDEQLRQAVDRTRARLHGAPHGQSTQVQAPVPPPPSATLDATRSIVKQETTEEEPMAPLQPAPQVPVENPLKQDMEDEDLRKLEGQQRAADGAVVAAGANGIDETDDAQDALAGLEDFELAAPEPFSQTEAKALIKESIARICEQGGQAAATSAEFGDEVPPQTLWATLVTRLASRAFEVHDTLLESTKDQDKSTSLINGSTMTLASQAEVIRQMMADFVKADFARRVPFAIQWLSEEWYCDIERKKRDQPSIYAKWLPRIVEAILPSIGEKDRTLFAFLSELPSLPDEVVDQVAGLCQEPALVAVGLTGLREFAVSRPPVRQKAVSTLLDLCRNSDTALRQTAIKTVRGWVGSGGAFEAIVLESAHHSLKRLTVQSEASASDADQPDSSKAKSHASTTSANGAAPSSEPSESLEEGEELAKPKKDPNIDWSFPLEHEEQVLQFVELPFVLSIKKPEMLDAVFAAYSAMPATVQKGVEQHIAALVRSLGPSNPKLLSLLKTFPAGADSLALSVFNVMAEKGRTQALISTVKSLALERNDVDPHFLIPILPNLNKAEIMKLLPRAVSILNSKLPEDRNTLKSLFASIVTRPPQGFGSISTNLPRVRDSDMLTPVELMGLLHSAEMETELKATADAIRICFSMTDVFRSEVLAAALNQLVEEPELPVLFMRTAIMAVSTYKSLAGYVSSNLLSRLIVKKVWQNKPLWDGFVICAEQTAPGSFAALLQLPQEQLLDVVKRKPALKEGLKAHLEKKVGNKARLNAYLELLDGADTPNSNSEQGGQTAATTPQHVQPSASPAPVAS